LKKLLLLEMVVPTLLCMSIYLSILPVEYAHDLRSYFRIMVLLSSPSIFQYI
jgi:hypothetical protein